MTPIHRRNFLKQAAILSIGFAGLHSCTRIKNAKKSKGFGALQPDPHEYLELPKGFSYDIISKAGSKMDDGLFLPGRPDGMATFAAENGKVIIVRNHENSPQQAKYGAFGRKYELLSKVNQQYFYDFGKGKTPGLGGTTTMVYNEETGRVEKEFLSLAGTIRNCAGGSTPWGTWITCEESVSNAGEGSLEKNHGYCFEVPATTTTQLHEAIPITGMGRFNHEAVCVDPRTGIVYETEDRGDGLIYRFIPKVKGKLLEGGRLQILCIQGQPKFETRNWTSPDMKLNESYKVEWLDIDDVESLEDDLRYRGYQNGAARFARGEGMWFGEGELYFACTNGGPRKLGQVFKYIPSPNEGTVKENEDPGRLELFAESQDKTLLQNCDNLTIAPWGDVILCEDNGQSNHIRGIKPDGSIYTLANNISSKSEFAGLTFSPSGKTLFVNIQENGDTLAIKGPWVS
ncbi:MAG: secreted PhoX family phosphatase [Gammaproteobacteria bacterium]|jgi:secreted PhoX family phosphatase